MPRISTALSPARRRVIHAIANMTLDHAPRRSLAEIAQRLNQARQSVHDTVRRLARDGYVWHDTQGWKLTGQGWTAYDEAR